MVIAAATLLVVIRPRPRGEANRLVRVFVEGLLEKLGTGQAVMDPAGLPAAFGDGRDTRVAWSSVAVAQRVRSVPKAAASRGAQTGPAPGKLAKRS